VSLSTLSQFKGAVQQQLLQNRLQSNAKHRLMR
jgi:hypothetical protein